MEDDQVPGIGYGLHVIADTRYELPVAFALTPASASEQTTLRAMIRATFAETPALAAGYRDFSADRGLDSAETKTLLWEDDGIRRLIDTRALWRDEKKDPDYDPAKPITRPRDPNGPIPSCRPKRAPCTASAR